ncbi:Piso0_000723 [Millerozyma farinosa CBS 7064]|uniref:Repressor of RNA polymerase III transcription MAF1 n=1 Tax=Pichia sorbitophila (strain ATCC MYA-4447 / BCRC 22081 / CBS 7064 / NBRC 10061 / NRRL Y-12695) TaxID=559304 RepID=G8YRC3_PICSO|nr:Piso0_000723 [Millerozyma farinosa CBS 7064]
MKFIDEVDIELVNQELNFQSHDNNLIVKGGCDLFTTKPIGSDRKLFKTIDKHLDQILEDNQLSHSLERERQSSINSLMSSSASSPIAIGPLSEQKHQGGSFSGRLEKPRRASHSQAQQHTSHVTTTSHSYNQSHSLAKSLHEDKSFMAIEDSPFGSLKNSTTRKTFAYLIAILNSTYPDHDFSSLQPTTDNFHKINSPEELIYRFNNILISLGKKEDLLNWIWDTVNAYMDFIPSRNTSYVNTSGQSSRKNSVNNMPNLSKNQAQSPMSSSPPQQPSHDYCQIYEFQPSDQSILEDLNFPYQTLWSYYWFIYNKKRKRVSFIYLNALNKMHYSVDLEGRRSMHGMTHSESRINLDAKVEGNDIQDVTSYESPDDEMHIDSNVVGDMEM